MRDQILQQAIVDTLAYFAIFNFALTREELWHNLFFVSGVEREITFDNFVKNLVFLLSEKEIETKHNFYFLPGRESDYYNRQNSVKFVEQKMKIAHLAIKKIRSIPFVRAVFLCNTVAGSTVTADSDIDVFIIVGKNRIFLTRFLVTFILSIFGLRRHGEKVKDRICLSFYTTEDNLGLSKIALDRPDIYLLYWLDQLVPFYDEDAWLKKIQ